jgi:hypothetical protein
VAEIRGAERRLERVEAPWRRGRGEPAPESGIPANAGLAALRREAITQGSKDVGAGRVLAVGPWREPVAHELAASGLDVDRGADTVDDPIAALQGADKGEHSAVVAMGVLPMLSPAELTRFGALAADVLGPDGVVIVDAFEGPADLPPQSIDVAMQRWTAQSVIAEILSAAGFKAESLATRVLNTPAVTWYSMVGRRAAR